MTIHDEDFYVQRTYSLPRTTQLTEQIVQRLDNVFDSVSPQAYRDTLIELYHNYIYHNHDCLPIAFRKMADQIWSLSDFFMNASKQMNPVEEDENGEVEEDRSHSLPIPNKDLILLLAGEELKSYKFFSVLRSIGLDDAFYQTNLVSFILKELDLDEESNLVLDTYFQLLDEHSKDMKATNESVRESALGFYNALKLFRES